MLLAWPLAADEFWSWHTFDYPALRQGRWQAVVHGRLHVGYGKPTQGRLGPVARYAITNRVSLIGGYYFGQDHDRMGDWATSHRLFGGAEFGLVDHRRLRLTSRAYVERFALYGKPDYFRHRIRVRYTTAHTLAPVVVLEPFFDAHGLLTMRYTGGMRLSMRQGRALEVTYSYDQRRAEAGPPRHILGTHYVFGRRE
ncbi:MAG TPA: DUF2490 domain-containing protein [Bryobacteraceae bacterium]|nr:DUF2490 domain-containing protein [Bryobacteraceae bacterium]